MKITAGVCRRILNAMPMKPPEIGGILGSSDGIISRYQLDDGRNSGCGCFYSPDVTRLNTTIKAFVKEKKLDVGFAYDGDADRCIAVDENGNVVDGDRIMYVCGKYLMEQGRLADYENCQTFKNH